jgi:tRNA nucleotidyltransferase (CCA-adding enzyme)
MALQRAAELSTDPLVRFGVLVHDLGKGVTDKALLPQHIGHEKAGLPLIDALCQRLRLPNLYRQFGHACSEFHLHAHRAFELKAKTLLRLLENLGAFRNPENLQRFLIACQADAQGRRQRQSQPYPQRDYLWKLFEAAANVSNQAILDSGVTGKAFGEKLHRQRLHAIKQAAQEIGSHS